MVHPEESGTIPAKTKSKFTDPEITLLSLSVQQLSLEARSLRESIQKSRTTRDTTLVLALLAIIAVSAVAVALHLLF